MNIKKLFTKTYRDLFIPLIIEQAFLTLIANFNVFLFSFFSDGTVAAIGISDQILNIGAMVANIVVLGSTILIIQHADKNNLSYVRSVIKESVSLNLLIGLLIMAVVFIFDMNLLDLMQTPIELKKISASYLRIVSISIIFLSLSSLALSILRAFSYVKVAVRISVTNTIITILGNLVVVILGLGGIKGVGFATLITRFLGMLLSFFILFIKIPGIKGFIRDKFNKNILKDILALGLPSAMEGISYNISNTIITAIIASIGTVGLTSMIYTKTITSFIFSIGVSAALAGQVIIGHMLREGQLKKINDFSLNNANSISLIAGFINLIIALGGGLIVNLFTKDPSITSLVKTLLFLQIFLDPSRVANEILVNELNVLKDVKYPVTIGIIFTYAFVIPLSFLFVRVFHLGIIGIWTISILDELIRRILLSRRLKGSKWRKINENEWNKV